MASIWFVEISQHDTETNFLIEKGVRPRQVHTWKHSQRTESGFKDIMSQADLISNTDNHTLTPIEIPVAALQPNTSSLEEYFALYVNFLIEKMGIDGYFSSDTDIPDIISFNFIPFFMRATSASRAARGIAMLMATVKQLKKTSLLFLTDNCSLFSNSPELNALPENNKGPNSVSTIDFEGNYSTYKYENNKLIHLHGKLNARGARDKILIHSDDSLRNALIYDTNINIGHFDLGSCHVRTHYDLEDFVKYDNVFANIYNKFYELTSQFSEIHVIATGLEDEALRVIGNRLMFNMENDLKMECSDDSIPNKLYWHNHFSYAQFAENTFLNSISAKADCVVILTDVINTGSTVKKFIDHVENSLNLKESRADSTVRNLAVFSFAIVKMKNSPAGINACVEINRPYLEVGNCPLCKLNQPKTLIDQENWQEDFRKVEKEQLTPLDFWEMVADCKAFKGILDPQTGDRILRVTTSKMILRYKKWLKNIILSKYRSTWRNQKPNLIITVDEDSGRNFAEVFMESLELPEKNLLTIHKDIIHSKVRIPVDLLNRIKSFSDQDIRAFLIDDGINSGKTMIQLKAFLGQYSIVPYGILVLDCRLSKESLIEMFGEDLGNNIKALYTWPFPPHPATENLVVRN